MFELSEDYIKKIVAKHLGIQEEDPKVKALVILVRIVQAKYFATLI